MDEFIEQFVLESRENVERATADLLALESDPRDRARLDNVFRCFHTLKGGAGIVAFPAMASAVHAAEDVLDEVRAGTRIITNALIGDCLACLDQVIQWLDVVEASGALPHAPETQADALVARFARSTSHETTPATPHPSSVAGHWTDGLLRKHADVRAQAVTALRYAPGADCFFRGVDPIARIVGVPGLLALDVHPASPWTSLDVLDPFACNVVLTVLSERGLADVAGAVGDVIDQCEIQSIGAVEVTKDARPLPERTRSILAAQLALIADSGRDMHSAGRLASAGIVAANVLRHAGRPDEAERIERATKKSLAETTVHALREAIESAMGGSRSPHADGVPPSAHEEPAARTLRVDATRIDALVNLTGELTVVKNAFGHTAKLAQERANPLAVMLKEKHAELDRLVGELQQSVLALRIRPLHSVFQRFPRLTREMSSDLGKPAMLVVEGGETEADKTIVEMLFEPLLHVLRNAMDHGVEAPDTRAALHKPATATIRLRAIRQGEHVVVEVSDDGAGMDLARIRQVALQRNVVAPDTLADMAEADLINLVFAPGFSTASVVTGLSGRGVGMDSVRTAVQRIGGRVEIGSQTGQGTTVRFTLPFSVMMTPVMVVGVGPQTLGIPLDAVVENLRVPSDRITPVGVSHAIVIRDQTVPLIELGDVLGLQRSEHRPDEATIVVIRMGGALGALRVDRVGERLEIMLKPLEGLLAGTRGIAGSTLLGDGSVLLILNLEEVFG